MDNIKNYVMMKLLFLLCLGRALGVVRSDIADVAEVFGIKGHALSNKHQPADGDDKIIRRIEEEMLALNKSGELPRDKRALGILLQGFMEALGYTVSPIQLGSLPNPTPAPMPGASAAQQSIMPMTSSKPSNASAPTPPPRQRETLRFTGVLNFGNNVNTSNIVNHLSQYEQLFHGPTTPSVPAKPAAPPPPPPAPSLDPRSLVALPEPLFVKIPLPIVPNLPPPQPPSPMPIKTTYHDKFTQADHNEEYDNAKNDAGEHGDYEEENNKTHHSEEYENKYEQQEDHDEDDEDKHKYTDDNENKYFQNDYKHKEEEPEENDEYENEKIKEENEAEDKNDDYKDKYNEDIESEEKYTQYDKPEKRIYNFQEPSDSYSRSKVPREQTTEREYKNNKNVVTYKIENKEIHDPSEVSEEVPIVGSKYDHAMYVGEPNWKKSHEDHLYKIAAEQEARAEALAEENSEREKNKSTEYELSDDNIEFHRNREKEIDDSNERHEARYEDNSKETPYHDESESESDHHHEASEKESNHKNYDPEYEHVTRSSVKPLTESQRIELSTEIEKPAVTIPVPTIRRHEQSLNEDLQEPTKYYTNYDEYQDEKEKRRDYYDALPISYDREKSRKDSTLRDSYGKSLEKPNGKVDERVAGYFTMFKNPQTGVYDPSIIQQYESSRVPYDNDDLVNGFKRIQKEYGLPESRYEEYEISDEEGESAKHRSTTNKQKLSSNNHREHKSEIESRKNSKKVYPENFPTTECDCGTRKGDVFSDEAKLTKKLITTELPPTRTAEAPLTFGPYYSTVKYLYDPVEYDQGIIARLTSYGPPTTKKFEDQTDSIYNPSYTNIEKHQTFSPTETGIPEKLITKSSLLNDAEVKEIKSWPAPFDYAFDNTERSNIVLRALPRTTANIQASTHRTPFQSTTSKCYEALTLKPSEFTDRGQVFVTNHDNDYFTVRKSRARNRPTKHVQEDRIVKENGLHTTRPSYVTTLQTTPSTLKPRRNPFNTEGSIKFYDNRGWTTYSPLILETLTPYPERVRVTTGPANSHKIFRQSDQNVKRTKENQQILSIQPTVKKKLIKRPPLIQQRHAKEESSNYVERDGTRIIPEPMPYYYNERINEFTDKPQSENEKVNVKEYRNRIASVKTSRVKPFHTDISTKFIKSL